MIFYILIFKSYIDIWELLVHNKYIVIPSINGKEYKLITNNYIVRFLHKVDNN